MNEVKVQLDAISSFPENIEKPVIYRNKPEQAVLWVQVDGDMSEFTMKEYAKEIKDEIVIKSERQRTKRSYFRGL